MLLANYKLSNTDVKNTDDDVIVRGMADIVIVHR